MRTSTATTRSRSLAMKRRPKLRSKFIATMAVFHTTAGRAHRRTMVMTRAATPQPLGIVVIAVS